MMVNHRWISISSIFMLLTVVATHSSSSSDGWTANGAEQELGESELEMGRRADDAEQPPRTEDKIWWSQLPKKQSRSPKPGGSRPKYDPGLKWIGLGKRPDDQLDRYKVQQHHHPLPMGPQVLFDMRRFFDGIVHNMRRTQRQRNDGDGEGDRRREEMATQAAANQQPLRFATRSKGGKNTYDPSLLWTGLGR